MSNAKQVVVAYDFSDHSDIALGRALELAIHEPEHVLHFVTVLDSHQDYITADEVRHHLLRRLRALLETRHPDVDVELYVHTRIGSPVHEIAELAEDVGADLIIVGSHGRSAVGRLLLGSVSEGVLRRARCPVLIARTKGYHHVELDKVVEREPHAIKRHPPHRYTYTSGQDLLTRPNDWPL